MEELANNYGHDFICFAFWCHGKFADQDKKANIQITKQASCVYIKIFTILREFLSLTYLRKS